MSRSHTSYRYSFVCILSTLALSAACSESSSNNWNKMFGENDRRVEPDAEQPPARTADASPPRKNPTPETSTNAWAETDESSADAPNRGDPQAIERYASTVNPPSNNEPRIAMSAPPASDSSSNENQSRPAGSNTMSETGAIEPSPVRTAGNRPVDPWANRPSASTNAQVPPRNPSGNALLGNPTTYQEPEPAPAATPAQTNPTATPDMADRVATNTPESSGAPRLNSVSVQPVGTSNPRTNELSRPSTNSNAPTNAGVDSAKEKRERELANQEVRAASDPSNIEEQFKLRTMYLFEGRDDEALAPIKGVTPDAEEIMLGQLRSMQATRSGTGRDPATWANRQLEALMQLQEKLRAKADLQVPKVVLCTQIERFGVYTPFESNDFAAGAPHDVLIYVEVDNFESKPTTGGEYRTRLGAKLSLLSKDGDELVSIDESNIEDFSRGVRRDFFLAFGPITIPATLPAGEYVVKVEIEDINAGKINSNKSSLRLVP